MKKIVPVIILMLLLSCSPRHLKKEGIVFEDMIYMVDGEEYECHIDRLSEDSVYAITQDGYISFARKDVKRIDIAGRREGYIWETVDDIDEVILKMALETDLSEYEDMGYVNIYVKKKLIIERDSSYKYIFRYIRGITSDKGRDAGTITHNYRKKEEDIKINFARTVTADGKVLHLREIAIEDASVFSRIPPYENLGERKFAMREVKPGNILDFEITVIGKISDESPYVLDVTLGDMGPTIEGMVEVVAPRDYELTWQQWNIKEPEIRKTDSRKILTWNVRNLPALEREENVPPIRFILPRVVVGLKDDWGRLAGVLREYLKGEYNPEGKNPEDIYREVISLIRFIDVPSLTYSPYPKHAGEVFNNRIANSLDKAAFLFAAYRSSGFPVELVLVRSKGRGEIADKVPSLYQFDGALVKLGNTYLDPCSELNTFGYIRPEYQGTEGLLISEMKLIDIPLLPPDKEKVSLTRNVKISGEGDAYIEEKITFTGKQMLDLRQLKYLREEQRNNILESYINRIISGAELHSYSMEHLDDNSPEVIVNLTYRIPGLGMREGDFMLFHIPGIDYSAYSVGAERRKYPIYWGRLMRNVKKIKITIPEGYRVRYIPEGIKTGSPSLKFESSLVRSGNTIIYQDSYVDAEQMVPVDEYPDYKKAVTEIAKLPEEWIILEK